MFDVNPLASVLTGDESNIAPSVAAVNAGLGTKAASTHTQAASTISDSTPTGRSVLTAADAPAARFALGLVIGTDVLAPNGDASGLQNIPASSSLPPLLPLARVATLMGSSLNPAGITQPSVVLTPNRIAFWLSQPMPAFTSLTLQITVLTAQATGKVRVGVYNRAADCGPGTLIGEGELDASSTGNKSITIACTNTVTGIKWLAINANVSSISVRGHALQSSLGRLSGGYAWYDTIYRSLTYGAHPANETSQATYTPLEATFPEIMWRGV